MTPEQFLQIADILPEPTLLLSGLGVIHAANSAVESRLGLLRADLTGRMLSELVTDPAERIAEYLRYCSRTRNLTLGSLSLSTPGTVIRCRCDGAVVHADLNPVESRILLRLSPASAFSPKFAALNQKIEELNCEIRRRHRVEQELRRERELLQVTLSSVGDALITTDLDCRVTFLNRVAERMTGWPNTEALGRPLTEVFQIINETTRQLVENPVHRVLREGVVVGLANHTVLVSRHGTECPISDSAAPIRGDDGQLSGVVLVFRDVTVEHDSEEALRQREQHLSALINATPECVKLVDMQGRLVEMNPAGLKMIEADSAEAVVGGCVYNLVTSEFLADYRAFIERVCQGERGAMEYDIVGLKGTRRTMESRAVPLSTPKGIYCLAVTRDVTHRRRAEQALRDSEAKFRQLAETIPQLAWTAHPNGDIHWYNRRWYEYTGTTFEQMQGWGWQSIHDPAELPNVLERWQSSISTGEPFDMIFPLKGADGQFRPFLTRIVPLKAPDGRILQWFGTNTDVSEIKAMEKALRDADQRKNEFLAMLAHELRNPLAPVRNALHILQIKELDPTTAEQARAMMERQVQHLIRMVDDLMDVSRIMRGKISLRTASVELAGVVARAVEIARPAIDAGGHQLTISLPSEPVQFQADAVRMAQVFANLLSNAARYTDRAGKIELSASQMGDEVVVRVTDNGIGIAPATLPNIFEMFFQAERTHKQTQGGLGVGLTIVRLLVELHGGTVEARSEGLGKGSEFIVRIPLNIPASQLSEESPQPGWVATPPLRVLMVDDNIDAAESVATIMRTWGHEVQTAHDGPSALAIAAKYRADVVLLDIGMPGMSGHEVAYRLRQTSEYRRTLLAAMTGYGADEDLRQSREAGMDRHLVKPVEPNDLLRLLSEARITRRTEDDLG